MLSITDQTLSQMRSSNKGQIISSVTIYLNQFSKDDLIRLIMEDSEIILPPIITTTRLDRQPDAITQEVHDMATDAKLRSQVIQYSYYPTNEVDTIVIINKNSGDQEISRKTIKHYLDGRQPEVIP